MLRNTREQVALITGASSGIGLELTRKLLEEGWQVIALNRSAVPSGDIPLQQAVQSGQLRIYTVGDLADYESLRYALQEVREKESFIDVLFNNAGGSFHELTYSRQGRETHYELMTVVPYIITMELKELLLKGHLKTVINTSSTALNMIKSFDLEQLERPKKFRKLLGPYAASKLGLSLWTEAVAPWLAKEGILIRSVDPGSNNTLRKGKQSGLPIWLEPIMRYFFAPPTHGASLLLDGAFGEHRGQTGVFVNKGKIQSLPFRAYSEPLLERLQQVYTEEYKLIR
ncbi:SDR family NAD(P)-dependent oxidoreductase [Paenibacillus senegalimassiliensis]|uniref:SDR family NAD(P)-dependent oxidoreductase n=1 Tax=Paenibacillus senegalimassiliensis TaxID=1737426 RepID=UPI00073E8B1A|nr:SDR family NAD(P)-dependent oxidoreductase [Paenibacillus senegalimassiliensis]